MAPWVRHLEVCDIIHSTNEMVLPQCHHWEASLVLPVVLLPEWPWSLPEFRLGERSLGVGADTFASNLKLLHFLDHFVHKHRLGWIALVVDPLDCLVGHEERESLLDAAEAVRPGMGWSHGFCGVWIVMSFQAEETLHISWADFQQFLPAEHMASLTFMGAMEKGHELHHVRLVGAVSGVNQPIIVIIVGHRDCYFLCQKALGAMFGNLASLPNFPLPSVPVTFLFETTCLCDI